MALSGEVIVGIIGVLAMLCVALPGIVVIIWRHWRYKTWSARQQHGMSSPDVLFHLFFGPNTVKKNCERNSLANIIIDSEEKVLVPRPASPRMPHSGGGAFFTEPHELGAILRLQRMRLFEVTVSSARQP